MDRCYGITGGWGIAGKGGLKHFRLNSFLHDVPGGMGCFTVEAAGQRAVGLQEERERKEGQSDS